MICYEQSKSKFDDNIITMVQLQFVFIFKIYTTQKKEEKERG